MNAISGVAIVTGAAGALGQMMADALREDTYHVILLDKEEKVLKAMANEGFECHVVDLTDEKAVKQTIDDVVEKHGAIDVLINNAGVIHSQLLINPMDKEAAHSYETFQSIMKANLDSVFLTGRSVITHMVMKRTKGIVINISSVSAKGNAGQTAYAAAKAGVNSMTKTWAKELGPYGIRVAAIAPGFIDTAATRNAMSEDALEQVIAATPLKQLGSPLDIISAMRFVIDNQHLSGSVIEIDGGLVI